MINNAAVLGIDIGSNNITAVVCDAQTMSVSAIGTSITSGFSKQGITDKHELHACVSNAVNRAEMESGISPTGVVITCPVPGAKLSTWRQTHKIKTPKEGLTQSDISSCIKQAKETIASPGFKCLHLLPKRYIIDKKTYAKPLGIQGDAVTIEILSIEVPLPTLMILTQICKSLDKKIIGIVYDPIAQMHACLTEKEKQKGCILVDIGGRFSKIIYVKNNVPHHIGFIPYGSEQITSDLSQCLSLSIPDAERLKIQSGNIDVKAINPTQDIVVTTIDSGVKPYKHKYICQIIEARLIEIIKLLSNFINFDSDDMESLVLTGEGSLLTGLPAFFKIRFGLDTRVAFSYESALIEVASAIGGIAYVYGKAPPLQDDKPSVFKRLFRWLFLK